jgi:hypothetical protein
MHYLHFQYLRMRASILISSLLLPAWVYSQSWDFFPLGQRTWTASALGGQYTMDMVLMDSIRTSGSVDSLFFRTELPMQGVGSCRAAVVEYMAQASFVQPRVQWVKSGDTLLMFMENVASPFFFLPGAMPGTSWSITSSQSGHTSTITCASADWESVFGSADSVKTFTLGSTHVPSTGTPISTHSIRLSKHHGLLSYVPFDQFLYAPYSYSSIDVWGLANAEGAWGFVPPAFDDFFPHAPGDILYWRQFYTSVLLYEVEYFLDSITAVSIDEEGVRLNALRWREEQDGTITGPTPVVLTYDRGNYSPILTSPPDWAAIGAEQDFGPGNLHFIEPWTASIDENSGDTMVHVQSGNGTNTLDTIDCYVTDPTDWGTSLVFSTRAGMERRTYSYNWPQEYTLELVASRIAGNSTGEIPLSLTERTTHEVNTIQVHPNPAMNELHISNIPNGSPTYRIVDAMGRMISTGTVLERRINLSSLTPGPYMLIVGTPHSAGHVRFVKQ